jgi:hypothetical protein
MEHIRPKMLAQAVQPYKSLAPYTEAISLRSISLLHPMHPNEPRTVSQKAIHVTSLKANANSINLRGGILYVNNVTELREAKLLIVEAVSKLANPSTFECWDSLPMPSKLGYQR